MAREIATTSIRERKALYRRLIEVINEGDWAGMDGLLSPEFRFHNASTPTLRSKVGYKGLMMALHTAFPPGRWTVEEMVAEGDKVVGWMRFGGFHESLYRGVAPTGREVAMECVCIAHFANGKIMEAKVVSDSLGLLVRIGGVPAPAQPTNQAQRPGPSEPALALAARQAALRV